jgi:hypothetical protein
MKKLVFAALAAGLGALALGIYRAGDHELPAPNTNADIVFHGGSASGRRITTKSWSANYDRIVSNADQTMLVVDGLHDGVIDKKGKPYLHVRAQHVTVNTISHDLVITGPLHVETVGRNPPRSFDTDSANWNDGTQLLTLPKRVIVHTKNDPPLVFGSATFNIKTGEIVVNDLAGKIH